MPFIKGFPILPRMHPNFLNILSFDYIENFNENFVHYSIIPTTSVGQFLFSSILDG
jgi:hypothetical protein